jgi:hypothetical protein
LHKGDDVDAPLLWIVDEAKNVKQEIFTGVDRCSYNAKFLSSSPGLKRGVFFDAFTKDKAQYVCVSAGLKDCPHISKEKVDRIVATYGLDHPFTRSSVFGEFMDQDELDSYVLSDSDLQRCLNNPPQFKPGFQFAFCDFGGGHDENVIAYRNGNKIELIACWREANKDAAAGRFIREFVNLELKPEQIAGDAADKEMLDLLEKSGWSIGRQNFGAPSVAKMVYQSWGAQAWLEAAAGISRGEWIIPRDDTLGAEATTRKKLITASGKLGIEEKYVMRKRNVPSPNRMDAVVGAMAAIDYNVFVKQPFNPGSWQDEFSGQHDKAERRVLAGMGASAGYG